VCMELLFESYQLEHFTHE